MAQSQWFDSQTKLPMLEEKAKRLDSFLAAVADGVIDDSELKSQEERLGKLMQEIEPQLQPGLHEKVTELLCELTAYNMMQVMHTMQSSRPQTAWRA